MAFLRIDLTRGGGRDGEVSFRALGIISLVSMLRLGELGEILLKLFGVWNRVGCS